MSSTKRRQTVFTVSSGEVAASAAAAVGASAAPQPRRHTAVAAVLGPHLHESLRRGAAAGAKGDVDLEVLLSGAEKLCGVYEPPGARERIAAQRRRYRQQADTLAYYEKKVAEQAERLERMGRGKGSRQFEDEDDEDDGQAEEEKEDVDDDDEEDDEDDPDEILTEDDLRREEEEVKELDRKKRELQERIRTMDKDLGGLLRM